MAGILQPLGQGVHDHISAKHGEHRTQKIQRHRIIRREWTHIDERRCRMQLPRDKSQQSDDSDATGHLVESRQTHKNNQQRADCDGE